MNNKEWKWFVEEAMKGARKIWNCLKQ